ncbi:unnamed protein product [Schistosoma curassoni]|uniref:RIIa domain-containing protein n=1 Tax=Schistosoma curassoni TaxID=6186 RepID=A0A183K3W7_9TREM|nr:unnamed protein product [Schistosoma curassoni]
MEPVMESLDIHSDVEDVDMAAHFLKFIGKEAYSLINTLALPEKPISFPYATLKELLLDYVKYINFECGKGGRSRKMIYQDIKNSTTLLHQRNPVRTQGYAENSLRICDISHVIVPDIIYPNDSLISDEIPSKSEENMLNESDHDRKPDVVLTDDPLLCNDILNKFEETISEESNLDVISNIICAHNAIVACGKLAQCEAQVLIELDFGYNSDDSISTAVYPYHEVTSNVYSNQCEKYVLNEATSFVTCKSEDLTLFRGRG